MLFALILISSTRDTETRVLFLNLQNRETYKTTMVYINTFKEMTDMHILLSYMRTRSYLTERSRLFSIYVDLCYENGQSTGQRERHALESLMYGMTAFKSIEKPSVLVERPAERYCVLFPLWIIYSSIC